MTTPTDAQVEAALVAGRSDRIQGFHYPPRYVIRDVYLSPEKQEIWSCDMSEPDAEDRFYHQCEIERERVKLTAAFSPAPAGTVEVKPLEWGPYPVKEFQSDEVAVAPVHIFRHQYQVQRDPWAPTYIAYLHPTTGSTTLWWESKGHASLDEAKAAAQADYEARIRSALLPSQPPADLPGKAVVTVPGVDSQVMTAAAQMTDAQKRQPEWLWFGDEDDGGVSFGRWQIAPSQAPYIRADLAALVPQPHPEGEAAAFRQAVNATDLVGAERHKCASGGPCSSNGDGCSCSDAELLRRAALTSTDRRA